MENTSIEAILDLAGLQLDDFLNLLRKNPDVRVLTRYVERTVFNDGEPANPGVGIVLDTETTSKDADDARIVEIGMVKFLYDQDTGLVYRVLDRFSKLKDPGIPIPPEVSLVNNIFDHDVAGQVITDEEVTDFVQEVDLVIAHNSSYDRKVIEREYPVFEGKAWACTMRQIDWQKEDVAGAKLEYIASQFGFFYSAHRAEIDCLATLEVLSRPLPKSGVLALKALLLACKEPAYKVYALDSPFETKDVLKKRGYRWHAGEAGQEKAWGIEVAGDEALQAEIDWMSENIYRKRKFRLRTDLIDAFNRFSVRRNAQDLRYF